jgi:hypothetical protein
LRSNKDITKILENVTDEGIPLIMSKKWPTNSQGCYAFAAFFPLLGGSLEKSLTLNTPTVQSAGR